jgi:hypothetical protein
MSLPLFPDEIPVSEDEVQAWLDNIPNLSATEFRRESYRKAYNVEEKIRNKKREILKIKLFLCRIVSTKI